MFAALFLAIFLTPLVNGSIIAVLTARTPDHLRAKVGRRSSRSTRWPRRSAFSTQLEHRGVVSLFTVVVLGITWMAIVFAAITWRHRDDAERGGELAVT